MLSDAGAADNRLLCVHGISYSMDVPLVVLLVQRNKVTGKLYRLKKLYLTVHNGPYILENVDNNA